ncbi:MULTISPECIES: hypothetical protein [Pseudoalteromonas]|uniref:hypothetical protein n=1 Tax=Pseudoalteromonas TaxID=53246 RepID=UPI000F774ECF|nr:MULTISPECIES: hypothetical protein [Pseudoalteromonas]MCG7564362.1 hypothetical protein [Pseudoalteromonas sp. McH1-42]MEC4091038.1 hypothetical protein [Pseudoalteromonas rubra]
MSKLQKASKMGVAALIMTLANTQVSVAGVDGGYFSGKKQDCEIWRDVAPYNWANTTRGNQSMIFYCNRGGYTVTTVELKIKRISDNTVVFREKRKQNLTSGYGHGFYPDLSANINEEYKMELDYTFVKLKHGKPVWDNKKTKTCKRTFTPTNANSTRGEIFWSIKSAGTAYHNNGCQGVRFDIH